MTDREVTEWQQTWNERITKAQSHQDAIERARENLRQLINEPNMMPIYAMGRKEPVAWLDEETGEIVRR